ncbi:hypothetical protein [Chromobacterium vaccinii]|uniref:hypothetical protein n=1 Tax=Chromobacterium vaccinii TaxID=1108595 RepID=UPI00345AA85A
MKKIPSWVDPSDAPLIEQNVHDYIVSVYRRVTGPFNSVNIVPISPGAEVDRGWDAAVMEVQPLFFQYKLPDYTSRPAKSQSDAYKQRRLFKYDDSDGCFHFSLRKMAKKAPKSQHQLMFEMESSGCRVYYVAPTFIDPARLRVGGYPSYDDRPWIDSHHPFLLRGHLAYASVPLFDGLICIPPTVSVPGAPEDHKFFFNTRYEVSLHSVPIEVHSRQFRIVLDDHISDLMTGEAITSESVDEFVSRFVSLMASNNDQDDSRYLISRYIESKMSVENNWRDNKLMIKMRALARVVKALYGIDMLIGAVRR